MVTHPLDALNPEEITLTSKIILDSCNKEIFVKNPLKKNSKIVFYHIDLAEVPKEFVFSFKLGDNFDRKTSACFSRQDESKVQNFECIVSLTNQKIVSWKKLPYGAQPIVTLEEYAIVEEVIKKDKQFIEAMKKRGLTNPKHWMIEPWTAGYYGDKKEQGKRLLRTLVYTRMDQDDDNGYAHPVEGVSVVVDLISMKIIELIDKEKDPIPIPQTKFNYKEELLLKEGLELRNDIKPLEITQPKGPSWEIEGNEVSWQNWKFRVVFNTIEGLTLQNLTFFGRNVCYRASVSEMVVPYGSTDPIHNTKNVFDAGEYGLGKLTNSLQLGCDCLGEIHYFDGVMSTLEGKPHIVKNAVCLHEEDNSILSKHSDWRLDEVYLKRGRRLIISNIVTVGNYEYGFYWNLLQDGEMNLEVKHTGIMNFRAIRPNSEDKYGLVLNGNLVAHVHQHIYSVRLDMCVDGLKNSVSEINFYTEKENNPLGNGFFAKEKILKTEWEAKRDMNLSSARFWKVNNTEKKNMHGMNTAYALHFGTNTKKFARDDSWLIKRAPWLKHHLWVTKYTPNELHSSGDYPNQSNGEWGGKTLESMTSNNRSIENTNVCLWVTTGITHLPRPEDFPIMPVASLHAFKLIPFGFFDKNPTLDVPDSTPKCHKSKL